MLTLCCSCSSDEGLIHPSFILAAHNDVPGEHFVFGQRRLLGGNVCWKLASICCAAQLNKYLHLPTVTCSNKSLVGLFLLHNEYKWHI